MPCARCGGLRRYASGDCIECRRVYNAEYRAKHKDDISETKARYRREHPEAWAKWYAANKAKVRERYRRYSLLTKFGITVEDYDQMLENQRGQCAICRTDEPDSGKPGTHFHIDHDHNTGLVRGLLCARCNVGIGHFRDDIGLLQAAQNYLLKAGRRRAA